MNTYEYINKMWFIHTLGYYSTIKRNEVLIHITAWINLENIMLTERSQTQKATYCLIPLIRGNQSGQIHTECRSGAGRRGKSGVTANGQGASFWGHINILKLDGGDGCTTQ